MAAIGRRSWCACHQRMVTLQEKLPEETFSAFRRSPDDMMGDLCLADGR